LILTLPTLDEAQALLADPFHFRSLPVLEGALPPAFVFEAALVQAGTSWLMPRLLIEGTALVGAAGFKGEPKNRTVEIGYNIAPAFQRRGFATQAASLLLDEAFATGEVDRVIARISPANTASRRVLEKMRFIRHGFDSVTKPDAPEVWLTLRPSVGH
jgi:[ribosomal protein S5]-alanine N-acetyltransferase